MHYRPSRTEIRVKRLLIALAALTLTVTVIFYMYPGLRLDVGHDLGLVPGNSADQVAAPGEADLIVISTPVRDNPLTQPRYRQEARYLLRYGAETHVLDLSTGGEFTIPLGRYDDLYISADRTRLLLATDDDGYAILSLAGNRVEIVEAMPPGDWLEDVFQRAKLCSGSSPGDRYALCIRTGRAGFRYVIGNWEIQVRPFGTGEEWRGVYRGRGLIPIVGFTRDEQTIYFQNELGIWRLPIE